MTPQPEAGDVIGQALLALTVLGGLLTPFLRGKSVAQFFQWIAKFALSREVHDAPAQKGVHADRDYLLALHTSEAARIGSVEKQVDEFKVEIQDDFDLLADKMRGMFDSALLSISNLRRDINHKMDEMEAKIVATNKRLDVIAQMVNSMDDEGGET